MVRKNSSSNIYYFLGNITSHILHALPLYRELGGTFVVTSKRARRKIKKLYDIDAINVDDRPYKWMKPGWRPKLIHEYIVFDAHLKRTYDFLNQHADIIIFYELFELEKPEWINKPKKIFLTHGNMLKSYMRMYPKRLTIIDDYDYMSALGPHMKQQFIADGITVDKLIDIGIARTDDVIKHSGETFIPNELVNALKIDTSDIIISYMPTFWGASSIYHTGLEIVRNIPEEYTLIFRPHPQTPNKLLRKYLKIIKEKDNVIYAPEERYPNLGLVDIFDMSSAIIGDVSSVMLEAVLTKKPLLFAYDTPNHKQSATDYAAIKKLVQFSESIHPGDDIREKIRAAMKTGINDEIWNDAIIYNFFDYDGTGIENIKKFLMTI